MSKKRNPTTIEIIAKKCKVKPNYVKSILKIGRVKPINFRRMKEGRMAVYVAYTDALAEERGDMPDVPIAKPVMYYQSDTNTASQVRYPDSVEDANTGSVSSTFVHFDEPTVNSTQDEGVELTVFPPQEKVNQKTVEHIDIEQVRFSCPCGCNKVFIINHKNLSYVKE